jgi:hypothetical protein
MHTFRKGHRVTVISHHPWIANRYGVIKAVEPAEGNRFLVKFDEDELRTRHDEDGDAVLLLGDRDLVPAEDSGSLAA